MYFKHPIISKDEEANLAWVVRGHVKAYIKRQAGF